MGLPRPLDDVKPQSTMPSPSIVRAYRNAADFARLGCVTIISEWPFEASALVEEAVKVEEAFGVIAG